MPVETVQLFLALLAVAAQAALLAAVPLALVPTARGRVVEALGPQAVAFAAVVALVCTGGSLYLSEVAHYEPCRLCWFQRACMYPLVPILAVAAWRRMRALALVGLALAGVGAAIATYHVVLERNPQLESDVCDPKNPCTLIWFERLGYVTIPVMALSGFLLVLVLVLLAVGGPRLADRP